MLALLIALSLNTTEALTPPPLPQAEVEVVQTPEPIKKRGYRPRLALLIPGATVFGISYLGVAVPMLIGAGIVGLFGGDTSQFFLSMIPVAGPIVFAVNNPSAAVLGAIASVAQFGGLSMLILSFVFPEHPMKWVNAKNTASVELTGTGLRGTF